MEKQREEKQPLGSCVVCARIPPKIVFDSAHKVFKQSTKQQIREVAIEACNIIEQVDKENRIFFCGKSQASLLSGLFFLQGQSRDMMVTQKFIAEQLGICTLTVQSSYPEWQNVLLATEGLVASKMLKGKLRGKCDSCGKLVTVKSVKYVEYSDRALCRECWFKEVYYAKPIPCKECGRLHHPKYKLCSSCSEKGINKQQ